MAFFRARLAVASVRLDLPFEIPAGVGMNALAVLTRNASLS
jgi:hypothetical protein